VTSRRNTCSHAKQQLDSSSVCGLVKNSWGPIWGESGYAWVQNDSSNIGYKRPDSGWPPVTVFCSLSAITAQWATYLFATPAFAAYVAGVFYEAPPSSSPPVNHALTPMRMFTILCAHQQKYAGVIELEPTFQNLEERAGLRPLIRRESNCPDDNYGWYPAKCLFSLPFARREGHEGCCRSRHCEHFVEEFLVSSQPMIDGFNGLPIDQHLSWRISNAAAKKGLNSFTLFTKMWRFEHAQPLPDATLGYRAKHVANSVFCGYCGCFTSIVGKTKISRAKIPPSPPDLSR
jgi:hypothetical protein